MHKHMTILESQTHETRTLGASTLARFRNLSPEGDLNHYFFLVALVSIACRQLQPNDLTIVSPPFDDGEDETCEPVHLDLHCELGTPIDEWLREARRKAIDCFNYQNFVCDKTTPVADDSSCVLSVSGVHSRTRVDQIQLDQSNDVGIHVQIGDETITVQHTRASINPRAANIVDRLVLLLDQAASFKQQPISAVIQSLCAANAEQVLESETSGNAAQDSDVVQSRKRVPIETPVSQIFEQHAERCPEQTAVVFQGRQFSYGEINRRANQIGHFLQASGEIVAEEKVALCIDRSDRHTAAVFGTLKAAGVYMPLESSLPIDRMSGMIDSAGARILLTDKASLGKMQTLLDVNRSIRTLLIVDGDANDCSSIDNRRCATFGLEQLGHMPTSNLKKVGFKADGSQLAYILFTSGSTGTPKGVMIENRSLVNFALCVNDIFAHEFGANDRFLANANQSFDVNIFEFFPPFMLGASIVIGEKMPYVDIDQVFSLMLDEEVTAAYVPATLLPELSQLIATSPRKPALRHLLVGAEAIRSQLLQAFQASCPDCTIVNAYGPTETTVCATSLRWPKDNVITPAMENAAGFASIGCPLPGTQILILDESMQPVPPGEEGEVYIGGPSVMRGYLNAPVNAQQAVVAHPDNPSNKLYKTGDIARQGVSGNYHFVRRDDGQIKLWGYRIELQEIEARIAEYSGVEKAIVQLLKEDEDFLEAYVTLKPGIAQTEPTESERSAFIEGLSTYLLKHLPAYMIPTHMHIFDSIPITVNGKVDYKRLAKQGSTQR